MKILVMLHPSESIFGKDGCDIKVNAVDNVLQITHLDHFLVDFTFFWHIPQTRI